MEELDQLLERQSPLARMLAVAIHQRTVACMWEFRLATSHCSQAKYFTKSVNESEYVITTTSIYRS